MVTETPTERFRCACCRRWLDPDEQRNGVPCCRTHDDTKAVENLQAGDIVDLEGDQYADTPSNDLAVSFEFEYAEVDEVEREGSTVVVHFTNSTSVGFPEGHRVKTARRRTTAREDRPMTETPTCRYCGRDIVSEGGTWIDPEAAGDDATWRETCDAHDTLPAEHEPHERNPELAEHLRTSHGFADDEPGGRNHEPGVVGFPRPLHELNPDDLAALHEQDHADYPEAGTPVDGAVHDHEESDR